MDVQTPTVQRLCRVTPSAAIGAPCWPIPTRASGLRFKLGRGVASNLVVCHGGRVHCRYEWISIEMLIEGVSHACIDSRGTLGCAVSVCVSPMSVAHVLVDSLGRGVEVA